MKYQEDVAVKKLLDAQEPGLEVAMDPDEAERLGAFEEDALLYEDAAASVIDLPGVANG